jgi:hypothetical protein
MPSRLALHVAQDIFSLPRIPVPHRAQTATELLELSDFICLGIYGCDVLRLNATFPTITYVTKLGYVAVIKLTTVACQNNKQSTTQQNSSQSFNNHSILQVKMGLNIVEVGVSSVRSPQSSLGSVSASPISELR